MMLLHGGDTIPKLLSRKVVYKVMFLLAMFKHCWILMFSVEKPRKSVLAIQGQ